MQETIITAETRVEGDISGQLLRIFGLVTGSMEAEEVIIERGGQVGGNIRAGGLRVFGRVDGAIFAQRVVIESSGMSLGGISAPSVSLAEGCTIQGRLDSNLPEPAASPPRTLATPHPAVSLYSNSAFPGMNAPSALPVSIPAPAPLAMLRGRHRRRLLLKTGRDVSVPALLRDWIAKVDAPSHVRIQVDVDPYSFL